MLHRLESDPKFIKTNCRKEFKKLLKKCIKSPKAFQPLEILPTTSEQQFRHRHKQTRGGGRDNSRSHSGSGSWSRSDGKSGLSLKKIQKCSLECPYAPCTEYGGKHLITNCPTASVEDKSIVLKELTQASTVTVQQNLPVERKVVSIPIWNQPVSTRSWPALSVAWRQSQLPIRQRYQPPFVWLRYPKVSHRGILLSDALMVATKTSFRPP